MALWYCVPSKIIDTCEIDLFYNNEIISWNKYNGSFHVKLLQVSNAMYTVRFALACPFNYGFLQSAGSLLNWSTPALGMSVLGDYALTRYATECLQVSIVPEMSFISVPLSYFWRSGWGISEEDRSSLSEPDTTEEKETENEFHEAANRGAGKALP